MYRLCSRCVLRMQGSCHTKLARLRHDPIRTRICGHVFVHSPRLGVADARTGRKRWFAQPTQGTASTHSTKLCASERDLLTASTYLPGHSLPQARGCGKFSKMTTIKNLAKMIFTQPLQHVHLRVKATRGALAPKSGVTISQEGKLTRTTLPAVSTKGPKAKTTLPTRARVYRPRGPRASQCSNDIAAAGPGKSLDGWYQTHLPSRGRRICYFQKAFKGSPPRSHQASVKTVKRKQLIWTWTDGVQ